MEVQRSKYRGYERGCCIGFFSSTGKIALQRLNKFRAIGFMVDRLRVNRLVASF